MSKKIKLAWLLLRIVILFPRPGTRIVNWDETSRQWIVSDKEAA